MQKYTIFLLFLAFITVIPWQQRCMAQDEAIPYENVKDICNTCTCLENQYKHRHRLLSCTSKSFRHILARWPQQFADSTSDDVMEADFSGNIIEILQQLPATKASVQFTCRRCGIRSIQAAVFIDVPNIISLDLSDNSISMDELVSGVFRGSYHNNSYTAIALRNLNLSHNTLVSLDENVFRFTPHLIILNLSYNSLNRLDESITTALSLLPSLNHLDLSYTGIDSVSGALLEILSNLEYINLSGNNFTQLPAEFALLGKTLQTLDLAGNLFTEIMDNTFLGLNALRRLNISSMNSLKTIHIGTFSNLNELTHLDISRNRNLTSFNLGDLLNCKQLIWVDISKCSLRTMSLNINFNETPAMENEWSELPKPWPNLISLKLHENPWECNCKLVLVMNYIKYTNGPTDQIVRCNSPYSQAGRNLFGITPDHACPLHLLEGEEVLLDDQPRFRRKPYIILTVITASGVLIVGIIIGFVIVRIRRKHGDFGTEPIRYTSVRNSNSSAFSHLRIIDDNPTFSPTNLSIY